MPNEKARVVNPILKWLRKNGAFAEKTHGSEYTRIGMPDIIACCDGRYVGVECKYPGQDTTDAQKRVLFEMEMSGAVAFSAESLDEVKYVLRREISWPS